MICAAQAGLPEDGVAGSSAFGLGMPPAAGALPARTARSFDEAVGAAARGRGGCAGSLGCCPGARRPGWETLRACVCKVPNSGTRPPTHLSRLGV